MELAVAVIRFLRATKGGVFGLRVGLRALVQAFRTLKTVDVTEDT